MLKKALGIIVLIMIMIGVGGCMKAEAKKEIIRYNLEEKKEIVLGYLKEKYNEEFVIRSMVGANWSQSHDEFYAYPKSGTEEDIFAIWFYPRDDGTWIASDGYFAVIIKDEYEEVMNGFVKDIYSDYKLYVSFGSKGLVYPQRLNKDTTMSEIYKEGEEKGLDSDTTVLVKESAAKGIDTDESLKKIAEKMKEHKLVGKIIIYLIYDEKFDQATYSSFDTDKDVLEGSRRYIYSDPKYGISEVR